MSLASPAVSATLPVLARPTNAGKLVGRLLLMPLLLPLLPVVGLMWICSLLQPATNCRAEPPTAA